MTNRGIKFRLTALVMTAVSGISLLAGEIAVPVGSTVVLDVDGEVTVSAPLIEGLLRKEGAGRLVLEDANFPDGIIQVCEGELRLVATNAAPPVAALPAWVSQTAALWFDANTNVVTGIETNGVVQWLDVREPDPDGTILYPRAIQHEDDPVPLFVDTDPEIHEQPYLSFGGYTSGQWLKWVNPDDTRLALPNIRHVFIVFGRQPGFGYLLGDWDWTQEGNVGRKDFHIGEHDVNGADCAFWRANNTADEVLFGQTYLNGRRIWDPLRERPQADYQLFALATAGNAYASNFCNDHNFKAGQSTAILADRQGGPRYCEVLIFTNVLTMVEQKKVSDYLSEKWLTRTACVAGRVEGACAAQVDAVSDAEHTLTMDSLAGEGLVVKSGAGTLQLTPDVDLFKGAVQLDQGAVASGAQRIDRGFVIAEGGQTLTAATGVVSRTMLEDAAAVRKSGNGTLTLTAIDASVTQIEVIDGTLRLSPPLVQTTAVVRAIIPNAGFEAHGTLTGIYQTDLAPTSWQLITDGNGKGGITTDTANNPWVGKDTIPEGRSAVFFQYHGGLKSTAQVPRDGFYRLSFQAAARYDKEVNRKHSFGVWIGAQQVAVAKTYFPAFERFEYVTPWLISGTHELRFQGIDSTVNRASIIDDVRLEFLEDGVFANVANPGFEYSDHLGPASNPQPYMYAPDNAAWSFDGPTDTCGITEAIGRASPGSLFARTVPEGRRCAFIKGNGRLSQTIAFPATGVVYRLSFQVAARERHELHRFQVLFGGETVVPYQQTHQTYFQTLDVTLPPVTNWTEELVFEGLDISGNTIPCSLFDDVRVYRVDEVAISNGSFEVTTSLTDGNYGSYATLCEDAGWIFEADTSDRKPGISGNLKSFGLPYCGGRMAFLQGRAVIHQDVTIPDTGVYALSFCAASRIAPWNGYTFEVCWAGQRIGVATVDTGLYRRFQFRLPRATAGETGEILFRGLVDSSNGALVDDVKIERMEVCDATGLLPQTLQINVDQGAKLELDFEGVLPVAGVRFGGTTRSHLINAETCPAYVTGTGTLYTPAKGTVILLR